MTPAQFLRKAFRFAQADSGSVKARVLRSGMWVSLSGSIGGLLNIVRSVVLARLLTPEMFGLMGLAGIAIRTIETFTKPGVSQALIARKGAFSDASETAFTLLIGRGVLLALLLVAVAPWVSHFYDADELRPILQVLSLVFVIGSLSNINTIARQKELDFRSLTFLGLLTSVLGTVATIAAAFWLRNVWALVIGQLASATFSTALSYWLIGGRLRLGFNRDIARELMTYGKFITGSSIMMFIAAELDSAVLGKLAGLEQLGFYALAYTIANLVTANLSKIVSSIMMPAYSKLQADMPSLLNAYLRSLSLVMFAILPISAGLIIVAEPMIQLVYGDKWIPAVLALQILAVFGLLRSLASFSGYLFEGIGMPRIAFYIGSLRLLAVAPLIVPMVQWGGLRGAAITATVGVAVQWIVGLFFLHSRLSLSFKRISTALWRPLWTTAVMAGLVTSMCSWIAVDAIHELVLIVASGVVVYGVLNLSILRDLRKERFT